MVTTWQPGMRITADLLNSITPQYKAWTPEWTTEAASTTSYGNAQLLCRYVHVGTLCEFNADITFGSSTVFPSGASDWKFSLPVPAALSDAPIGYASLYPSSSTKYLSLLPNLNGNDAFSLYVSSGSVSSTGAPASGWVDSSTPFTWASGFRLLVSGQYETAA